MCARTDVSEMARAADRAFVVAAGLELVAPGSLERAAQAVESRSTHVTLRVFTGHIL